MKSTQGWVGENYCNGNNLSGFSALPGGYRGVGGNFGLFGKYAFWWSSTEFYDYAYLFYLQCEHGIEQPKYNKGLGFSVRCIKDSLDDK